MKKNIFTFLYLIIIVSGYAQGPEKSNLPLSPTAASIGLFGQIEMDYFNGLPSIVLPIYDVKNKSINFPINLLYHASGVRPDIHTGWVGQNWSLNCNFSINRVMYGDPDEAIIAPGWLGMNYPFGQSYLNNYQVLNRADWHSTSTLNQYLNNYNLEGDSYDVQHRPIPAPDEFIFNFLGYSGSFFLNHEGDWKFKCNNDGGVKLESIDVGEFYVPPLSTIPQQGAYKKQMIKSFVLMDGDGTKYFFGGDIASIEFSRAQVLNNIYDDYGNLIIANSWYLTKIQSVTNDEVNFEYQKSLYYQMNYGESWDNISYSNSIFTSNSNGPGGSVTRNLINATYLTKISFADGYLDFVISPTNDLIPTYPIASETYSAFFGHRDFQNILPGGVGIDSNPKYFKLESIVLKDLVGNIKKEFVFGYDELPKKRLMLNSFKEKGLSIDEKKYKFSYYEDPAKPLPNYLSRQLDHWGFWNGRNWFVEQLPSISYNQSQVVSYRTSREANFTYAVLGSLKQIIYPTGGHTLFRYELNDYSGLMNYYGKNYNTTHSPSYGIDYESIPGNPKTAGGLRIKEIENFDNVTTITNVRKFEYKENATQSSGILHGLPQYSENGTFNFVGGGSVNYFRWVNYSIQPFGHTKGNHVTYSQVKEILPDNSYILRKYSNQNNLEYRDKVLVSIVGNSMYGSGLPYNDLSLERGLLLEEDYYSNQNILVKKLAYKYNTDPNRTNNFIRYVDFKLLWLDFNSTGHSILSYSGQTASFIKSAYAFKKFIYDEKVSKIEEFKYDIYGGNEIRNEKNIIYNNDKNIKEENWIDSKGKQVKIIFKYSSDYSTSIAVDDASQGIEFLKQKKINKAIIETLTIQSDANGTNPMVISAVLNIYKKDQPQINKTLKLNLSAPIAYTIGFDSYINGAGNFIYNSSYLNVVEIKKYDANGNVLEMVGRDGLVTTYLWGYNAQYLVAKIINKSYDNVVSQSGIDQTILNNYTASDAVMSYELSKLRVLSNCFVSTYTFKPLIGLTSETDPNERTIYYEYDAFNRLTLIKDKDNNILKKICYNYAGQPENCKGYSYFNDEKSEYFTRNNCESGYEGSTILYTVPANTYTSFISKADANQLAQNDISINGQNYANNPLNSTCTYVDPCVNVICENEDQKCIGGSCEQGIKVWTESIYEAGIWFCTYHYEFSDGSWSTDYQITSGSACG